MILSEYIRELQSLIDENPEAAELEVVYSRDDEGNGFQSVYWTGTLGHYDGDYGGDFITKQNLEEEPEEYEDSDYPINAVCIN